MSVLKQLLGVHKKTSNIAVLLDTGRHPLSLTAKLQAIKYFLRFPAIKHNRLLSAYHESEKLTTGTFTNFVATNLNKFTPIWINFIKIWTSLKQFGQVGTKQDKFEAIKACLDNF